MSAGRQVASIRYEPGRLEEVREFLKRTRSELRIIRRTRVYRDRVCIYDVNDDWFEVENLGWTDADVVAVLAAVNAAFNRDTIHNPTEEEFKQFKTGRRYAWAADRVM
ncbi:MAG: hypothetical protein ACT4QC_05030 [Planctomycetaceae bacterium]